MIKYEKAKKKGARMIYNKKSSILLILKILEEYSDEEHFLTQQEIIEKVKNIYNVELERKSVAFSLSLLQELDYDINKSSRGGYALLSRALDPSEVRYITDALFSSKTIDAHQAVKLSKALSGCLSKYQRRDYNYIHKSVEISKFANKDLFFIVETIEEAKKKGKRVSFQYIAFDSNGEPYIKRDGFRYIVSPYYTVNSNGRYYLICNYREKYRPISAFRIDYIRNIQIEDEWDVKPLEKLQGMKEFNISKYLSENIYLLSGEPVSATIEIEDENTIGAVIDWFGGKAKIYKSEEDGIQYARITCNESALFYWCMQYSESIKVVSPQSLIDRIKGEAERILKKYEKSI